MEGEDQHSDAEGSFSNAGILKKMAIILAGPIVNLVFGILIYFILITVMYGLEVAWASTGNFIRNTWRKYKNACNRWNKG